MEAWEEEERDKINRPYYNMFSNLLAKLHFDAISESNTQIQEIRLYRIIE